jgi:hypothetical protein
MDNFKHFLTFGSLKKEETLSTLEHNILTNTLVVENMSPFPGYHHDVPIDSTPNFIFLILNKSYYDDEILRATRNIKRYFSKEFDACPGTIHIHTEEFPCIRLRGLEKFDIISEIQTCYMDEGIKMHKSKAIDNKAIIMLNKSFSLEQMDNGIYKDLVDKYMYYIQIPVNLKWKVFEKLTYSIKNNVEYSNFDAALGFFYINDVTDFVRIYAHEPTKERLESIRNQYLEEMEKMLRS